MFNYNTELQLLIGLALVCFGHKRGVPLLMHCNNTVNIQRRLCLQQDAQVRVLGMRQQKGTWTKSNMAALQAVLIRQLLHWLVVVWMTWLQ